MARASTTYRPRSPGQDVLYRLVLDHFETFRAEVTAEQAAHLVDHVLPDVPVRRWVLSLSATPRSQAS